MLSRIINVALIILFMHSAVFSQERITSGPHSEYHPKWHPLNTDTIYYTFNTGDVIDIYKHSISSGISIEIPIVQNGALHFDITPDGKIMIFDGRESYDNHSNLFKYDFSTNSVTAFKTNAACPTISPDGLKIAYKGPNNQMYISNIDGSNVQVLTSIQTYYEISDWSPDGTKLAITSEQNGNSDIWIINADGTGLRQLTTNPERDYWPCWSPDGQKIAFTSATSDNFDIWVVNQDGTNLQRLTTHPSHDNHPEWSSDGNSILFSSPRNGTRDVWILDYLTNNISQLRIDKLDVIVSPNPSSKEFRIKINSTELGKGNLYLYSEKGSLIYNQSFNNYNKQQTEILLNTTSFESGIYLLLINIIEQKAN